MSQDRPAFYIFLLCLNLYFSGQDLYKGLEVAEFSTLSITQEEKAFYERVAPSFGGQHFPIPLPTETPRERTEQRCAFRNQRCLYRRECDLTGQSHITIYKPQTPFPVYSIEAFWGDGWEATDFGLPYDPQRGFMEQVAELYNQVPRLGMMNRQCQNSEYCNYSYSNKNCYLVFSSHYEEDCFYGNCSSKNKFCMDYHWCAQCELCYECLFSSNCYHSVHLDHCSSCYESWFCIDCRSCKHCLFCANLRHKEYCIFNEQLSKEEYFRRLEELRLDSYSGFGAAREIFLYDMRARFPFRAVHQVQCENCEGTDHTESRNIQACFQADTTEDTLYSTYLGQTYDCVDVNYMGFDRCELSYQCIGCTSLFHGIACDSCWHCSELLYSSYCFSSHNCLGCISLKHKDYCILNRQYSKEEYEKLAAQIVASMVQDGSWGQFFPKAMSAFGHNETVASEWYARDRDSATAAGFNWLEKEDPAHAAEACAVPDSINDVTDDLVQATLICEETGKPYKIETSELNLLRKIGVPVPHVCPDARQKNRLKLHSPWELWTRKCAKTGVELRTTFAPDRPERVYAVEAYLKEFE
ncbi:hypothetical protein OAO01_01335 [Oligoflexia bacterium]|nr:hypothetical protein [Oligoflexia bacterium]